MFTLKLVAIVNKKRRLMDELIKPLGFSRLEWQILSYLSVAGEDLTQKQLNCFIDNDCAFITRALDKLEEKKLIRRKINADDKRQRDVQLTAKGRPIARRLYDYGKKLNDDLMEGLSENEINTLYKLTGRIEDNIKTLCEKKHVK